VAGHGQDGEHRYLIKKLIHVLYLMLRKLVSRTFNIMTVFWVVSEVLTASIIRAMIEAASTSEKSATEENNQDMKKSLTDWTEYSSDPENSSFYTD
jgi:hypothetical protein